MTSVSTHVLDAVLGRPAAGLAVALLAGDRGLDSGVTDADGRLRFAADLDPGVYGIRFGTGDWFAAQGRPTFYPEVAVVFAVAVELPHVHVPLLLSPFAYSTYRGS